MSTLSAGPVPEAAAAIEDVLRNGCRCLPATPSPIDEMGLGKTRQVLALLALRSVHEDYPINGNDARSTSHGAAGRIAAPAARMVHACGSALRRLPWDFDGDHSQVIAHNAFVARTRVWRMCRCHAACRRSRSARTWTRVSKMWRCEAPCRRLHRAISATKLTQHSGMAKRSADRHVSATTSLGPSASQME